MPTVTLPHGTVHYRTAGPADAAAPAGGVRPRVPRRQPAVGRRRRRPSPPPASARTPPTSRSASHRTRSPPTPTSRRAASPARSSPSSRPRPHRRDARRQRHRRRDLPVPARHRRLPDRPARADQLRRLRAVPAGVADNASSTLVQPPVGARRRRPGDALDDVRHGRFGYGPFATSLRPGDDAGLDRSRPASDPAIRRGRRPLRRAPSTPPTSPRSAPPAPASTGPVRLVWGNADPYFPIDLARRLAAAFGECRDRRGRGRPHVRPRLDAPDRRRLSVGIASQRPLYGQTYRPVAPRCWVIRAYISGRR